MELDIPELSTQLLHSALGTISGIIVALVVYRMQARGDKAKYEALLKQQKAIHDTQIRFFKRTLQRLSELVDKETEARQRMLRESEIRKYLDDPEALARLRDMFNLLHQGGGGDVPPLEIESPPLRRRVLTVFLISALVIALTAGIGAILVSLS